MCPCPRPSSFCSSACLHTFKPTHTSSPLPVTSAPSPQPDPPCHPPHPITSPVSGCACTLAAAECRSSEHLLKVCPEGQVCLTNSHSAGITLSRSLSSGSEASATPSVFRASPCRRAPACTSGGNCRGGPLARWANGLPSLGSQRLDQGQLCVHSLTAPSAPVAVTAYQSQDFCLGV